MGPIGDHCSTESGARVVRNDSRTPRFPVDRSGTVDLSIEATPVNDVEYICVFLGIKNHKSAIGEPCPLRVRA